MACGKTTLGSALARAAQVGFVDLDIAIEREAGISIKDIFANSGELAFRKMETDTLHHFAKLSEVQQIIACGGGTPCHGDNMDFMLRCGTVVWLKADRESTLRRIRLTGDTRPLLAGKSDRELSRFVDENFESRKPFYERAHHVFDSSRLETVDEVAQSVELFIDRFKLIRWQQESFM